VYVRHLGHKGVALASGKGDDEVEVQVGIMRVRAKVHELEMGSAGAFEMPHERVSYAPQMSRELHLLGKRAEEASDLLEPYLYDAMEEGLTSVRIVHGFGTGVLKQVVQDILRRHPAVRDYRPGEPNEGGGGVTIAELRH
jgi:DNA mismatch repair protein MutS2